MLRAESSVIICRRGSVANAAEQWQKTTCEKWKRSLRTLSYGWKWITCKHTWVFSPKQLIYSMDIDVCFVFKLFFILRWIENSDKTMLTFSIPLVEKILTLWLYFSSSTIVSLSKFSQMTKFVMPSGTSWVFYFWFNVKQWEGSQSICVTAGIRYGMTYVALQSQIRGLLVQWTTNTTYFIFRANLSHSKCS